MANDEKEKPIALDRLQPPVGGASPPAPSAEYESPTLVGLEPGRRPKPSPICAVCPHSLWSASADHLMLLPADARRDVEQRSAEQPDRSVRWDPAQRGVGPPAGGRGRRR